MIGQFQKNYETNVPVPLLIFVPDLFWNAFVTSFQNVDITPSWHISRTNLKHMLQNVYDQFVLEQFHNDCYSSVMWHRSRTGLSQQCHIFPENCYLFIREQFCHQIVTIFIEHCSFYDLEQSKNVFFGQKPPIDIYSFNHYN